MTADVYTIIPKLFIQLNPICHQPKMTTIPSAPYCFLSPLHNNYTTATTNHTDLVGEAIHFWYQQVHPTSMFLHLKRKPHKSRATHRVVKINLRG
jgi:hypothetical protein